MPEGNHRTRNASWPAWYYSGKPLIMCLIWYRLIPKQGFTLPNPDWLFLTKPHASKVWIYSIWMSPSDCRALPTVLAYCYINKQESCLLRCLSTFKCLKPFLPCIIWVYILISIQLLKTVTSLFFHYRLTTPEAHEMITVACHHGILRFWRYLRYCNGGDDI